MGKESSPDENKSFRERVEQIRQRKEQNESSPHSENGFDLSFPLGGDAEAPTTEESQDKKKQDTYSMHKMAITKCNSCSQRVPMTRYCHNCKVEIYSSYAPSIPPEITNIDNLITKKVEKSPCDTISTDVLLSDHDKYTRELGDYLFKDEIPIVMFETDAAVIAGPKKDTWRIDTSLLSSGHAVVSNKRIFGVFPQKKRDQIVSIDYAPIKSVDSKTGWTADAIRFNLFNDTGIKFSVLEKTNEEFEDLHEKIEEQVEKSESEESQAASFVKKADQAICRAENAEEALQEVANLFADRDEETEFDRIINDVDSTNELLVQLSKSDFSLEGTHSADTSQDSIHSFNNTSEDSPELSPQSSNPTIRRRISDTMKNANKQEVALYGIGSMIALKSIAVSAPISTSVALATLFTGGAATGAYASTHPNSLAAQIDPVGLVMNSRSRGREWDASSAPGNQNVGEILGAIENIGEQLESEYAHWLADADIEQIQQGAAFGAQRGDELQYFESSYDAAVAGGLLGLTYGYAENAESNYELNKLLDEDLYDELLEQNK